MPKPWAGLTGIGKVGALPPDDADALAYQWVKTNQWTLKDFRAWLAFRTKRQQQTDRRTN